MITNTIPTLALKRIGNELYSFVGGNTGYFEENSINEEFSLAKFATNISFSFVANMDVSDTHLAIGRLVYTIFLNDGTSGNGYFDLSLNGSIYVLTHVDYTGTFTILGQGTDTSWTWTTNIVDFNPNLIFISTFTVNKNAIDKSPWQNMVLDINNYTWKAEEVRYVFDALKADKFYITPYTNISTQEFYNLSTLTELGFFFGLGSTISGSGTVDLSTLLGDVEITSVSESFKIYFRRNTNNVELFDSLENTLTTLYDGSSWVVPAYTTEFDMLFGSSSFEGNLADIQAIMPYITWTRQAKSVDLIDVFDMVNNSIDNLGQRINVNDAYTNEAYDSAITTFIRHQNFDLNKAYEVDDIVNISSPAMGYFREMKCTTATTAGVDFDATQWTYSDDDIPTVPFVMHNNEFFIYKGIAFYYRNKQASLTVTQAMLDTLAAEITAPTFIARPDENYLNADLFALSNWEGPGSYVMFWKINNNQDFISPRGPFIQSLDFGNNYGLTPSNFIGLGTVNMATDGVQNYYDIGITTAATVDSNTLFTFSRSSRTGDDEITTRLPVSIIKDDGTMLAGIISINGATSNIASVVALTPSTNYRLMFQTPVYLITR